MANHVASAAIMVLLWAFEIAPVEGEARPDPKNAQFVDEVVAYVHLHSFLILLTALILNYSGPVPFRCQFRPRSEKVIRLIREVTIDV